MSVANLELRGVTKAYGNKRAVDNLTASFAVGERVAILGPSGSGKSTTLRLLAGLEAPSDGQVLINGSVASARERVLIPPHRRGISMVFQDLALWPNLTAMGNVMLGLAGAGMTKREARIRACESLERCSIAHLADRRPGTLSGGEQQRVALARALAPRPSFLFLDEPFANLDLTLKERLFAEIDTLTREESTAILLVSHDPAEAQALSTHALLLDNGRIVAEGPLTRIIKNSDAELMQAFRRSIRLRDEPAKVSRQRNNDE